MNRCWYSPVFVVSKLIVTWRWAWAFGLWKHWVSKTLCGINLAQICLTVLNLLTAYNSIEIIKKKLILIWSRHLLLTWKFKSWTGKLLKTWGSNPCIGKSNFCVLFSFQFQSLRTKVDIFYFNDLLISCLIN